MEYEVHFQRAGEVEQCGEGQTFLFTQELVKRKVVLLLDERKDTAKITTVKLICLVGWIK